MNISEHAGGEPQELLPRPEPALEPEPAKSRDGLRFGKRASAGAALLLAGAIAVGLLPLGDFGTTQPPPPMPLPLAMQETAPQPAGPSLMQPVAAAELVQAIDGMQMSGSEKARLHAEVVAGKTRVGWVTVSDFWAEDGDQVTVSSGGFSQDIPLFHRPTTIAVPYTPGVPAVVTGKIDGGGGITVAVHVGASIFRLAPMAVGTSVQVPTP